MTVHVSPPATPGPIATNDQIREAQTRVIERLEADPAAARSTIAMTGRVGEGLACAVSQGKFTAVMDMSPAMGGAATGPSPGFFARAGITGCIAIATKMAAAREGLRVRAVEVEVETDFDDLALFGRGQGRAGPSETRVTLRIEGDEPKAVIDDLVARVLEMDPWFLALRDSQVVKTRVATVAAQ